MKHKKHAALTRPSYGQFARNEWAIIGTPCGNIKSISFQLTKILSADFKVSYVDADHKSADDESEQGRGSDTAMSYGANLEYTDKISFHRFDTEAKIETHQFRQYFNEQDIVLVNGNHFKAKHQIVVVDPRKEKSLEKKLDRLTDVQLILMEGEAKVIPGFLKKHLADIDQIPVLKTTELDQIASFLKDKVQSNLALVNGLVLAGGKSMRMGRDKTIINYHGKPQREYMMDLMGQTCEETFLSCRQDQVVELSSEHKCIADSFLGLGPFGAILSAFREQPDSAWLVVASDLPLLNKEGLDYLMAHRDPSKIATAFLNPATDFPDPLVTIWEPRSYPILLQFLAQGYSCPRKVLINSDINLIEASNPNILKNVNKPEEYEEILKLI